MAAEVEKMSDGDCSALLAPTCYKKIFFGNKLEKVKRLVASVDSCPGASPLLYKNN